MSEDQTPRLKLPVLQIGQSAKEATHNEALALLDLVAAAAVEDVGVNVPPAYPAVGQCWIVGDAPAAEWVGNAQAIAGWTVGGWRFVAPIPGLSAWCIARARRVTFYDRWEDGVIRATRLLVDGVPVVGPRQPAIATPQEGVVIDVEARAAIADMLTAMRAHGLVA